MKVPDSELNKRVVVYKVDENDRQNKIGEYPAEYKTDRMIPASNFLYKKLGLKGKARLTSWDAGYGDPNNPNKYVDSDFVFVDGLEGIKGFNFVYLDGFPVENDFDALEKGYSDSNDDEEKPFFVNQERPIQPEDRFISRVIMEQMVTQTPVIGSPQQDPQKQQQKRLAMGKKAQQWTQDFQKTMPLVNQEIQKNEIGKNTAKFLQTISQMPKQDWYNWFFQK